MTGPVATPRAPIMLSPRASFAAGFVPTAFLIAALFWIVRRWLGEP